MTMTIGELKAMLDREPEDARVVPHLSFIDGWRYAEFEDCVRLGENDDGIKFLRISLLDD
jgi:hypothetical protein